MDTETTAATNFTASTTKVMRLLAQKKLTVKDIEGLNKIEREYLEETFTGLVQQLKGAERDDFLDKIDLVVPASTKSDIWEYNHAAINSTVSGFMREHGIMPTQGTIAKKTGLSRQTVAKHFNAYTRRPEITAEMEQFKFMVPRLLANIYKFALNGDTKAARLYFEMVGAINKKQTNTVVNEQNNYIQINNTILSQENLKRLTAEQLNQIESIITNNA
jgi:hypothetical protein